MPKLTKEEKQNFADKLQYLGLDLENIPSFLTEYEGLEYRPSKVIDDKEYVVYRYLPIDQIQILITPTNRLTEISEKYAKAKPIADYLNLTESEESIECFATFLNMLKQTEIDEIEEVAKSQQELQKQIPFQIRYEKNYLWQIHYSFLSKKYFMLVPSEDAQFGSFFYLLKKQIEFHKNAGNKPDYIYVPIVMAVHDGSILKRNEIKDIENYLWLFTKEWPNIYEVTDMQGKKSVEITGETHLEEELKAYYKIHLENEKEAAKFYKLVKALFILQTELSDYYNFRSTITKEGQLEFSYLGEKVDYERLSFFIKQQCEKIARQKEEKEEQQQNLIRNLEILKQESSNKEKEYLMKQKEIATYLAYKKTFLGRVKYFFSKKRTKKEKTEEKIEMQVSVPSKSPVMETKLYYTIEDLVEICHAYTIENTKTKNLILDSKALEEKIKTMNKKIENANLYLEEIDSHKKSIFEFWRFTNKDDNLSLQEGEKQEKSQHVLKRVFEYESDIEDIGKQMDKVNQETLSKEEQDSLFITKTSLMEVINKIKNHVMVTDSSLMKILEELKKEADQRQILFQTEEYDIFGALIEDRTQVKLLNGKKHREAPKDKFQILNITKDTTLNELKETLKQIDSNITKAMEKGKLLTDVTIYATQPMEQKTDEYGYHWYHMKAENAIMENVNAGDEIKLIKLNVAENMPGIYDTNILYFDNYNKTLPLGMDLSDKILIQGDKFDWKLKREDVFYTNAYFEPETIHNQLHTKRISLYEYDLILKEKRNCK